jgi:hypothetical protein
MHPQRPFHRDLTEPMKTLTRFLAVVALALHAAQAPATNVTTDVTDVWWPSAEAGWGIQLIQNADVIFATMFVYGTLQQPLFFVAFLQNPPGGSTGVWTGALSAAHGSYFGDPWSPGEVGEIEVGTMTFTLTGIGTGLLTYNVGTTSVSKTIERQALKLENNDGSYRFTHTWAATGVGCTAADAFVPASGAVTGDMSILHVDPDTAAISLQWKLAPVELCSMSASYLQLGRLGQYQGTLNCPTRSGTLTLFELANRVKGLSGRYTIDWNYSCRYQGRFAGVSNVP